MTVMSRSEVQQLANALSAVLRTFGVLAEKYSVGRPDWADAVERDMYLLDVEGENRGRR